MSILADTSVMPPAAPSKGAAELPRRTISPRRFWLRLRLVSRWLLRKTTNTVLTLYALALGAGLGLVSAEIATRGDYHFGGVRIGAWTAWPRSGSVDADPYIRAVNARGGEIPLAVGEGMLMTAADDDDGKALDARCRYRIAGTVPMARAWTLTVSPSGSVPEGLNRPREGFTSTEILRDASGQFVVSLDSEVQPGNWIPVPRELGPIRLALRLYDTPVAASVRTLDRHSVPAITRLGCGS